MGEYDNAVAGACSGTHPSQASARAIGGAGMVMALPFLTAFVAAILALRGKSRTRVPSRVVAWDELPHNETGKLLRRTIKEQLSGANGPIKRGRP